MVTLLAIFAENNDDIWICDAQQHIAGVSFTDSGYIHPEWDSVCGVPEDEESAEQTGYRLYYYSFMRPSFRCFHLDDTAVYHTDVIDTWAMTVTDAGDHQGSFRIDLPGKPYMAIRIRKTGR